MRRGFVVAKNPEPYWRHASMSCIAAAWPRWTRRWAHYALPRQSADSSRGSSSPDHGECIRRRAGVDGSTPPHCRVRGANSSGLRRLASRAGRTISSLASIVDVAPTLARALGWPMEPVDGTDLLVSRSDRHVRFESPAPAASPRSCALLGGRADEDGVCPDHHVLRALENSARPERRDSSDVASGPVRNLARVVMTARCHRRGSRVSRAGRSSRGPAREGRGGGRPLNRRESRSCAHWAI